METIGKTLVGMMTVREIIDARIKMIRIGEVDTCDETKIMQEMNLVEMRKAMDDILSKLVKKETASLTGFKNISGNIMVWKKSVADEIMRVMILPEMKVSAKFEVRRECEECIKLEEISFRVENLLTCAGRNEEIFTEESLYLIVVLTSSL